MKTVKILLIADNIITIDLFKALLDLTDNRDNYKIFVTEDIKKIARLTKATKFNWIIFDGELNIRDDNFKILEQITTMGIDPKCVLFTSNAVGAGEQAKKQFGIRIVEKTFKAWESLIDEVQR